jgi:tetratricopeptide (TPR) repeat protein
MTERGRARGAAICGGIVALVVSCGPSERQAASPSLANGPAPSATSSTPSLPDVSTLAPTLQARLKNQYADLQKANDSDSNALVRGEAFGAVGRLLLAAELPESSEAFFANAQAQMPNDLRWPYYLGHVARQTNRPSDAVSRFARALELQPDHVPSLVWIADAHLALGHAESAEPYLAHAVAAQPGSAAAWFRRGRAALARGDYRQAVEYLERARTLSPAADAVTYQLGVAYRSAGDLLKAAPYLRQPADAASIVPNDPLMDSLPDLLKGGGEFYVLRGLQAMEARKWSEAVADLRAGADLLPHDASVRVNLATALFVLGDPVGARAAAEASLRLDPRLAKAHYVLGLIFESDRRDGEAIDHLAEAVRIDGGYIEALASLADALRRTGRVEEALTHYTQVLTLNPNASQARFGYGIGLVRLGRYREAVVWLDEASTLHSDQPGYAHAVARLLAASPDQAVRNGPRALALMETLTKTERGAAVLETMAMALAEVGRFDDAVDWQRRAIAAARAAKQELAVSRLQDNLTGYERRQPCREPWRADDPVHRPGAQP